MRWFMKSKNAIALLIFVKVVGSFSPAVPRIRTSTTRSSSVCTHFRRKSNNVEIEKPKPILPKEATTPVSDHAMWTLLPSMFEKQSNARATKADVQTYTGYVPAGLTKEQYLTMRKKEQRIEEKKDYTMWGPRFATTERPDGDWMVQPSLWRNGFIANSPYQEDQTSTTKAVGYNQKVQKRSVPLGQYITPVLLYYLPVALLTVVSLQLIHLSDAVKAQQKLASANASRRLFAVSTSTKVNLVALGRALPWARNIVISLITSPILDTVMAKTLNRKLLWSRSRCLFSWNAVNIAIGFILMSSRAVVV